MQRFNSPWLALLALVGILYLAWYSYPAQDYTVAQVEAVNKLAAAPHTRRERIMDLWGLSEEDVSKPVNIWRKP